MSDKWVKESSGLNVLVVDLGRTIGFDPDGNALSAIRVAANDFAEVISAYPVPLPQ